MSSQMYAGKVALVTGGASGIGRATVEGLAREGAKVAFTDINADAGQPLEAELTSQGHDVIFVRSDATKEDEVKILIDKIVARWGRLDVAINNVGNTGSADCYGVCVHDSTLEGFESTLEVSLKTTFLCMKYEIQQMLKQGGGVIANTGSLAGFHITQHATPGYSIAKAGVAQLSRYAAVFYAKNNIRVNIVAPGITETPSVLDAFPTPEIRSVTASEFHPMGRMMTPDEMADAFLWVCSDRASGVTGLTISVDGGWAAK